MVKHTGLGKGLAALIPGDDLADSKQGIQLVNPRHIKPNPRQPRTSFNAQEMQELADSIRENGIIQPLIISPAENPGEFYLVAGERRLMAARSIQMESVPVIIRDVNSLQQLELALVENVQREDLSPLETAEAYRQLTEEFSLTHDEVAQKVGKSRVAVTNSLRLLKLPEKVKGFLRAGTITEGHARVILALPTVEGQTAAAEMIVDRGLNVRQTEQLIKGMMGEKKKPVKKPQYAALVKDTEDRLRDALGTKVKLNYSPHGGSVVIRYYSDEELEAVVQKITRK